APPRPGPGRRVRPADGGGRRTDPRGDRPGPARRAGGDGVHRLGGGGLAPVAGRRGDGGGRGRGPVGSRAGRGRRGGAGRDPPGPRRDDALRPAGGRAGGGRQGGAGGHGGGRVV